MEEWYFISVHSCFESISCLIRCHIVRRALERRVRLKVKIRHWRAGKQNKKCCLYLHINFGWDERRGQLNFFIHLVSSLFLFLCSYIYVSCLRGMFSRRRSREVTLSGGWRRNHVFFPFSFFGVYEGMRFWKWILITAVKVFAYSANIGWRSLRCVCGPSWRCILGFQRA